MLVYNRRKKVSLWITLAEGVKFLLYGGKVLRNTKMKASDNIVDYLFSEMNWIVFNVSKLN